MSNLGQQLDKITAKQKKQLLQTVRATVVGVAQRITIRSPVDKGTFRANWMLDLGKSAPKGSNDELSRNDWAWVEQRNFNRLTHWRVAGFEAYFVNNLPYAERLEYGYSARAPNGMVRLSLREANNALFKAIAKNR